MRYAPLRVRVASTTRSSSMRNAGRRARSLSSGEVGTVRTKTNPLPKGRSMRKGAPSFQRALTSAAFSSALGSRVARPRGRKSTRPAAAEPKSTEALSSSPGDGEGPQPDRARDEGLEVGAERGQRGVRSKREQHHAAPIGPCRERSTPLRRKSRRIFDHEPRVAREIFRAIGKERNRAQADVELQRGERLFDRRSAAGDELGAGRVGDDGDGELPRGREDGSYVVGADRILPGHARQEIARGTGQLDAHVDTAGGVGQRRAPDDLVSGRDFDASAAACPGRKTSHPHGGTVALAIGAQRGAIGRWLGQLGEGDPQWNFGGLTERRSVGMSVGEIAQQHHRGDRFAAGRGRGTARARARPPGRWHDATAKANR